ncbi:MAG: hypothetical protein Q7S07_01060 [Candidatus Omnitrophota bacterium]|nr:hypothetical protein [Candidatus Omnitrophota bacterium]
MSRLVGEPVSRLNAFFNRHTGTPAHRLTKLAFTLIEVLVATAIAAIMAIAVIAVFAAGIKVYERMRDYSDARADIMLSLEQVDRDLRNTLNISEIKFNGESGKVTFPAPVDGSPGSVSYYVDDETDTLVKEEKDYYASTSSEESGEGRITPLAAADGIKFSYCDYDSDARAYLWKDTWESEDEADKFGIAASKLGAGKNNNKNKEIKVNTPLGIRMEIQYHDRGESAVLYRTAFFPLAVSSRLADEESGK